jgi:hypothetical protein
MILAACRARAVVPMLNPRAAAIATLTRGQVVALMALAANHLVGGLRGPSPVANDLAFSVRDPNPAGVGLVLEVRSPVRGAKG